MRSCRRDRHTASRNSAGSTTEGAPPAALRRFERPCQIRHQDAVRIPGRERYVTDSKTAAKPSSWFHDTRLSSVSARCFEESVANKANRVAKFLALGTFGLA
jgi:hypothetical protein